MHCPISRYRPPERKNINNKMKHRETAMYANKKLADTAYLSVTHDLYLYCAEIAHVGIRYLLDA